MTKQISPHSSVEDLGQWEIIDIDTEPQPKPMIPDTSCGSFDAIDGNEHYEEKDIDIPNRSSIIEENHDNQKNQNPNPNPNPNHSTVNDDDDEVVFDLEKQYQQQQRRLQVEQNRCRQLTQEVAKSILVTQDTISKYQTDLNDDDDNKNNNNNNNNKTSATAITNQAEFDRIISENKEYKKKKKKQLQQLEIQRKESQRIVEELLRSNEQLQKKLEELHHQRDQDKHHELKRQQELFNALEINKQQQLMHEIEKEKLEKEKALLQKEKDQLRQSNNNNNNNNNNNIKKDSNWKCRICGNTNNATMQYCQSCTQRQHYDQNTKEIFTVQPISKESIWKPCEEQEYAWILKNNSNMPLKINVKLERVKNEKAIVICEEDMLLTYEIKENGELRVVVNARAPSLCGKYHTSWQMTTSDRRKVGPPLEMYLWIKSDLSPEKESKVEQMICDLGFTDRESVIAVLTAHKWNIEEAAQHLLVEQSK